jgi:hypothetical protein
MGLWAWAGSVMMPQCFLYLVNRGQALTVGVPVPEQHKALSTDAAVSFCVSAGSPAKYLHF